MPVTTRSGSFKRLRAVSSKKPLPVNVKAKRAAPPPTATNPPSLASTLPSELIESILSHAPTPYDSQHERHILNLVSRHWYLSTRYPIQYSVTNSRQAEKLAANVRQRTALIEEPTVIRRINLCLVEYHGIKVSHAKAFEKLLDACPELDTLSLHLDVGTLNFSDGQAEDVRIRLPEFENGFIGLEEAIKRQPQLRVLKLSSYATVVNTLVLIRFIRPLKCLRVLDLQDCRLDEDTTLPRQTQALQIPLRTLGLLELGGPYDFLSISNPLSFAGRTLQRLRVGSFWSEANFDLSPFVQAVSPFANHILDFELKICRLTHLPFSSKPFLDLNDLLRKMTSLERLGIAFSACERESYDDPADPSELGETTKVDISILGTLRKMRSLQHLVLHVQKDVPLSELEAFAKEATLRSLTILIMTVTSGARVASSSVSELPRRMRMALPSSTKFHVRCVSDVD
ncbi:hypothetical protein P7C70_g6721, partial [Phenoliferia sp. Uapishka_3]